MAQPHPTYSQVPPFPWDKLRMFIFLGGFYRSDTSIKPVLGGKVDQSYVPWQSIAHPERGAVGEALRRAFFENAKRHNMTLSRYRVFLACELGLVTRVTGYRNSKDPRTGRYTVRTPIESIVVYDPVHPEYVMPEQEATRLFHVSQRTIAVYCADAKRAIQREWEALHSGLE